MRGELVPYVVALINTITSGISIGIGLCIGIVLLRLLGVM